jgi:poly(3-hydroxybutyrate) depolymerase
VKFIAANDQPQSRAGARDGLAAEDTVKPARRKAAVAAAARRRPPKAATVAAAKKPVARKKPATRAAR